MSTRTSEAPNVLVIHADQHRLDCLGCNGNTDLRTPHIDAVAADGVRYENSFCPFPICTPSRYSLLSGLYVHEHRGWSNHCTLRPGTPTFPSVLRDAGYATKAVGKMHFTPTYLDVGFDEMLLAEQDGPGRWDDDYHRDLRNAGLVDVNDLEDQRAEYREHAGPEYWDTAGALPSNLPNEFHTTAWIGNHAVSTLESWGPSANLLMVGFVKPHHPFDPPAEWCDSVDPEDVHLLPGWTEACFPLDTASGKGYFPYAQLTEASVRRATAYYYATIQHLDHEVGRMVDALKRKGIYDNTLIVYTSDHGDYMGYHHMLLKGGYMYDPLVKVPLVIKRPRNPGRGAASQALVSNVDVAPTILREAGCDVPATMHGLDLVRNPEGRDLVFAESHTGGQLMARSKTRKLIVDRTEQRTFLYDLEQDPLEMANRADDPAYHDDLQALSQAVEEWFDVPEPPEAYLDEDAPRVQQPNVPPRDNSHRPDIVAYYREAMAKA